MNNYENNNFNNENNYPNPNTLNQPNGSPLSKEPTRSFKTNENFPSPSYMDSNENLNGNINSSQNPFFNELPSSFNEINPSSIQYQDNSKSPNNFFSTNNQSTTNSFIETPSVNKNIIYNSSLENINKIKIHKNKKIKKGSIFQTIAITLAVFILGGFMISSMFFHFRLFHISGTSMEPTIDTASWVLSSSSTSYNRGDIVAFYHHDVIMIKRVIGLPGDTIDIDDNGNVYVNGTIIEEPYLSSKAKGEPEITLPYKVHNESYFVLGDNRKDSIDSRNITIGAINSSDIVGKVSYSIIPYKKLS